MHGHYALDMGTVCQNPVHYEKNLILYIEMQYIENQAT